MRRKILPMTVLLLIASSSLCFASLYDEEIKISADLQRQLQTELDNVLGKEKSSALVRVELMLEPSLRDAIKKSYATSETPAAAPTENPADKNKSEFSWKGEKTEAGSYTLPGFPTKKKIEDKPVGPTVTPPKADPALVLAAGTIIKKISVKISLDRKLPNDADNLADSIATGLLNLNADRGDTIDIARISMPSAWSKLISNPESLSQVIQKGLIILGGILVAFLLVYGALSIANILRRSSDKLASAIAATRERKMDINYKGQVSGGNKAMLENQDQQQFLDPEDDIAPSLGLSGGRNPDGSERSLVPSGAFPGKKMVFDVGIDQVGKLYHMLHREKADDIALVLPYLDPNVRNAFLALLPKPTVAEILSSLSSIRFMDPDVIVRLKSEMERRLKGAVGGIDQVIELIQNTDGKSKRELLEILKQRNPTLAKEIRTQILLFEDVMLISDAEVQLLLSAVKTDDLSLALAKAQPDLVEKLKSGLTRKMQDILQQMMTFRAEPSEDKIFAAQDRILNILEKQVHEGKIKNPLLNQNAGEGESKQLEPPKN